MGGGAGAKIPASGGFLFSLPCSLLLVCTGPVCVCQCVCVVVCFQVVNLDPVIEDDAELQKYSKVRRLLRVWVLAQPGFLTLALTLAPAHPHAASRS